jgi:hypothetical protein
MNCYSYTKEVWCSKRSWAYLQVLFELLFYLTKVLNMAIVLIIVVMLGQTSEPHWPEFCNVVKCHIFLTYFI